VYKGLAGMNMVMEVLSEGLQVEGNLNEGYTCSVFSGICDLENVMLMSPLAHLGYLLFNSGNYSWRPSGMLSSFLMFGEFCTCRFATSISLLKSVTLRMSFAMK